MAEPSHNTRRASTGDSVKETLESVIIAFVLAFVFRAYVVEAFVIPTGSMAPTLLGRHLTVTCPQCGYRFSVGVPETDHGVGPNGAVVVCPMCGFPIPIRQGTQISPGDRILVHKYIYSITDPRRWDVVVFKNPQDENRDPTTGAITPGPTSNFIKRLVGLPGETLEIIEGNVYVKSPGDPRGWHIARKGNRPRVQRAVWQPIYDSRYIPLDHGDATVARHGQPWHVPWQPADGHPDRWQIDGRRSYHHDGDALGRIAFNFRSQLDTWCGQFPYNQFDMHGPNREPIEDVRLAATFDPAHPGLSVTLCTTARTDKSPAARVPVAAHIAADGQAVLEAMYEPDKWTPLTKPVNIGPLLPGQPRALEFWYVDQEACLWVGGRRVLDWRFEIPYRTLVERPPLTGAEQYPHMTITVKGSPVTLHHVIVSRDLYYTTYPIGDQFPRGALDKEGGRTIGGPIQLDKDEFFCMGDNSPRSSDGRFWPDVNPWIKQRMLQGKGTTVGIVPRDLMMGRAFFVYFPAPFAWTPRSMHIIPNFADMRFIH